MYEQIMFISSIPTYYDEEEISSKKAIGSRVGSPWATVLFKNPCPAVERVMRLFCLVLMATASKT